MNNAQVTAEVRAPSGERTSLPMEWTVDRDGQYQATFLPREKGVYEVTVSGTREGIELGSAVGFAESKDLDDEYFQAELGTTLLGRIADETGRPLLHAGQRRPASRGHELHRRRDHHP